MSNTKERLFDVGLFKRLFAYTKPYRFVFFGLLVIVLITGLLSISVPYLLEKVIDEKITPKIEEGFLELIALMLSLVVLESVLQFVFSYYASWLGQHMIKDIRDKLFNHMLRFKMKYYDNSSVGLLVTRAVTDMERIGDVFGESLFAISKDIMVMLIVSIFMVLKDWKLSLIVFVTLPIVLYATKVFQKYMKKAFEQVRTEVSNMNSFVQERVTGMKILQLFTREETEYDNFKEINNRHKKAWIKTVWYNSIFFPIGEFLSSITIGLVVWYGGLRIVLEGESSTGVLFAFVLLIPKLFRPLRQIADKFNTLQMGMVAATRVFKILDTTSNIDNSGTIEASNFKGNISFKDVVFSYVKDETVLKGISFNVKQGETIAIVGATGAGKSTIINLLNRFYEIDKGEICIDETPINNMTIESLRQQIAVVLQDVFLFADTILNNITLNNPDITLQDVETAAKSIGVHEFIMQLPNGYLYNVKERGVMLSSGQRQLISFLRAYVTNPSILVLDEATSSVDSYTEQLIQNATDKITRNRTSIVIAHRLATVKNADKIIVMDSGEIIEQGTHTNLLNNPKGYYRKLYNAQFLNVNEK
jgi:ABC-type multidrug transport system fused ATPase/permease subunit